MMRRLWRLFHKPLAEKRLDAELRFHVERQTAEYVAAGMSEEGARRRVRMELEGIERLKEGCRESRRMYLIEDLAQDVRYGLRLLRKSAGFTAIAVFTLALGIGANTAIFSVVQGVLLAPLPYSQPGRLALVWQYNLTQKHITSVSYPDFLDWQRGAGSIEQMAAVTSNSFNWTSPGAPEHLRASEVSADFFNMLGVKLEIGRDIAPEEDKHGGAPVVIISDRLWRERFDGSRDALGKPVTLDGAVYTIIGVFPPGFRFLSSGAADVYTPIGQGDPLILDDRTIHAYLCVARVKPGISMMQAQDDMSAVQESLNHLYPTLDRGLATEVVPLKQAMVGNVEGTLLLLMGAVGVVLLIACANVANLLLARSTARAREFAVRASLGAGRVRIVRQLVTESVLLSIAGGGLGLALANWGLKAVLAAVPSSLPRSNNISLNIAVLLFALGVSVVVGILFGLAPALKSSRVELQITLKEGGRGSTGGHHRAQSSLVIVQMALTLVLLVGAGLLLRTIRHLLEVNPGFDAQNVVTFRVGISPTTNNGGTDVRTAYRQLVERIRQIPGVQAADLTALVPMSQQDNSGPFWVSTQAPASLAEAPRVLFYWIGTDYLKTMGIPLLRGRSFTPEDTLKSDKVVVIDSTLARDYFHGADPVGQTITIPLWGVARIIGVAGHVKHWELGNTLHYTENQMYISVYELPDKWVPTFYENITLTVRTPLSVAALMPGIRAVVHAEGGDQPVYAVQAMQDFVAQSMTSEQFPMILLGTFAGLALLLASVGIYGVISYSVAQRVHEIGVRMALGAEKRDVFRMIIGQGLRLAVAGVGIGGVAALILMRLLSSFSHLLYGVGTSDPVTFAAVSLVLTVVAVLACYLPARRATRTDPMVALRHE